MFWNLKYIFPREYIVESCFFAHSFHIYPSTEVLIHIYGMSMYLGFPGGASGKESAAVQEMQETWIQSLGEEDPLEQKITTHSSILAWEIQWTEKPGRLKFKGSQRVGHD